MDCNKTTFTGSRDCAVGHGDHTPFRCAGHTDGCVVLLRAVNPVRKLVINIHPVNLCGRLVVNGGPGLPTVETDISAAIVALYHALVVERIYPKIVVVTMRCRDFVKIFSTVGRFPHLKIGDINCVWMGGVRKHMGVVPGSMQQVPIG